MKRFAAFVYAAALILPGPLRADPIEDWYVLTIAGSPAGYVLNLISEEGGLHVETQSFQLRLNRMGSVAEMGSEMETREDSEGRLVGVEMELDMSSQVTTLEAIVEPGRVLIAEGAGEASFDREMEYEGNLLGPEGVRSLIRARLKEVGDYASYQTFHGELGMVVELNLELVGRESDLLRVQETLTGMPMTTTYWLDSEGKVVRSSTPSPFGVMETVLSDAASAKMAAAGNALPEESYGATLAVTQVRLPEPRRSERVVVELRHRNPALGWPALSAPGQTVLQKDQDRLLLEVRRIEPRESIRFPVESSEELAEYLEANAYIQSEESEVRELAQKIVGNTTDVYEAVVALERWVAETMTFDMGVVLAPSTEVLENRRGNCTEYAVLLTTMSRSLGIPSRFVMGYVYVGGIYGGHAWTEVWTGDRWVGFDGAVPTEGAVDAARIAFLWTSLTNGIGELNIGPGLQMYGQIDVAVLEYALAGGPDRTFAPDEEGVMLTDHGYTDSALGVAWMKPEGYIFSDMDRVWPETGLVRMEGPDGEAATLSVRDRRYWQDEDQATKEAVKRAVPTGRRSLFDVSGRRAILSESKDRAALALVRGSELWLLEVEAPAAGARLRKLAAGLRL